MKDGPDALDGLIDVSRETVERLQIFERLLRRWQGKTNLVGSDTLDSFWSHHVGDGVFLYDHGKGVSHWVDIGAGAGLPGLVVAILAAGDGRDVRVDLVEATAKKSAFQRTAVLECGLRESSATVGIHSTRIEAFEAEADATLTARALAPLADLLVHMQRLGLKHALFLKGERHEEEVQAARALFDFLCTAVPHPLQPSAALLDIRL